MRNIEIYVFIQNQAIEWIDEDKAKLRKVVAEAKPKLARFGKHLPERISGVGVVRRRAEPGQPTAKDRVDRAVGKPFKEAKEDWVSSFERDYIHSLLKKNSFNISHAAREADIDRKYFRKLMKKYGLEARAGDSETTV